MRNYKKNRAKARSPWETYNYWYDKYTKGEKKGWFRDKLTESEFNKQYDLAKKAKMANPAKAVAQSQEYVDREFEKKYKKRYGKNLPDIRDKKARENLFIDFMNESGIDDWDEARDEFEKYFY